MSQINQTFFEVCEKSMGLKEANAHIRLKILEIQVCNEIIKLTDQQAKHRDKVAKDKHIKKFISVVGKMIVDADEQLQILIKQREELLNEEHKSNTR